MEEEEEKEEEGEGRGRKRKREEGRERGGRGRSRGGVGGVGRVRRVRRVRGEARRGGRGRCRGGTGANHMSLVPAGPRETNLCKGNQHAIEIGNGEAMEGQGRGRSGAIERRNRESVESIETQ